MMKITHFFPAIAIFLFTACATTSSGVQQAAKPAKDPLAALDALGEFGPLADGASMYVSVDVQKARPVLNLLPLGDMKQEQFSQILDRTSRASLAFYPKGSPQKLLVAARGDYPNVLTSLSLTASAGWKQARAWNDAAYWRSDAGDLSVALNAKWALASDAEPFAKTQASAPAGFEAFRSGSAAGAALAGWTDSASSLNRFFSSLDIPIEIPAKTAFFSAAKAGERYDTLVQIEAVSEDQAKNFAILFSLARLFIGEHSDHYLARALLANPAERDGVFLKLRIGPLDADGVAGLFTAFSKCME